MKIKLDASPTITEQNNSSYDAGRLSSSNNMKIDNFAVNNNKDDKLSASASDPLSDFEDLIDNEYSVGVKGLRQKEQEDLKKDKRSKKVESKQEKENKKKKRLINPDPITNEEYFDNYKRRVVANRVKKYTIYSIIIASFVGIVLLNLYFIFIREVTPIETIAAQVKSINKINNYPSTLVQKYLDDHAAELITETYQFSSGKGVVAVNISNIEIGNIAVKTDNNANVYFSALITTNVTSTTHNFILPLYYDENNRAFHPSGKIVMSARKYTSDTEYIEASLWDFGKIKKYDKEKTEKVTNYLSNFFEILYNNKDNDISTFYSGNQVIGDDALTFIGINECSYYKETNPVGANALVTFTCSSTEGLTYTITNYITVKETGEGKFEVTNIY